MKLLLENWRDFLNEESQINEVSIGDVWDSLDDLLDEAIREAAPQIVNKIQEREVDEDVNEFMDGALHGGGETRTHDYADPPNIGEPAEVMDAGDKEEVTEMYRLGYEWGWDNPEKIVAEDLPESVRRQMVEEALADFRGRITEEVLIDGLEQGVDWVKGSLEDVHHILKKAKEKYGWKIAPAIVGIEVFEHAIFPGLLVSLTGNPAFYVVATIPTLEIFAATALAIAKARLPKEPIEEPEPGHLDWYSQQQPLQEAMPEERAHIEAALELEPEQLAFNDLFDGKKRLVYDLPAADKETEAGRFVSLWAEMGYKVDWNKGIVTGEKADPRTFSVDYLADEILADAGLIAQSAIPKTRTIKMKIGKWFSKVQGYLDKILKMDAEVEEKTGKSMLRRISMQEIEEALGKERAKEFNRNVDMLNMMAGEEMGLKFLKGRSERRGAPDKIKELAKFWQNNADYLKKNIDDLLSGLKGYAVVITRHPMDVFRMGDFMEIYDSCHRPPSKASQSTTQTNEYYQCAVAEAHGHGAIAYVVDREALLDATDASTLEEVEDTIQEGELFKDEDMPYFESGELLPIQRIRLRQVRYYTDDLSSKHAGKITLDDLDDASAEEMRAIYLHAKAGKEAGPGVELAVPEMDTGHLYGTRIPEFGPWLLNWAQQNQTEELRRAPRTDTRPFTQHGDEPWQWGTLDLSKFVKFGGSYEDTSIKKLITRLYGPDMPGIGYPVQDRTTQDNLDVDIVDTTVEDYQVECNRMAEEWNNRYADCVVEPEAYDDGGGDVAIGISAEMWVTWDLDEWKRLPSPVDGQHAADELRDYGLSWIADSGGGLWRRDKQVVLRIKVEPEGVLGFDRAWAYNPEDFEDFCVELNKIDDQRAMVKAELERYFLREGDLKGSVLQVWGMEVLNEDHDIIRWDLEAEEGYDREIESVTATIHPVVQLGDVPREVADNILGSWNFWTKIRSVMADTAQQEVASQYFPDSEHDVLDSTDDEIETELKFIAEADDPDEQVEVMKVMVDKWDDLDEVNELVNNIFRHFVDLASQGYEITEEQRLLRVEKLLRMV